MKLLEKFIKDELNLNPAIYSDKFLFYEKLILERNKEINLVSRQLASIENQILNSVFFISSYRIPDKSKIVDVGTGGGFPGIPLKILNENIYLLLLDSITKKINVVSDIVSKLNLKNTEIICGRAEDISKKVKFKNNYDFVISKSVAALDRLYNWGNNFLKPNGKMLCIKGGDIKDEIKKLRQKVKSIKTEIISYRFDKIYKIEDKKLVIIYK